MGRLNVNSRIRSKVEHLERLLGHLGSALVAYSGGVDSTFLAYSATRILDSRALVVIARSPVMDPEDFAYAKRQAADLRLNLQIVEFNQLDVPDFAQNEKDRCYHCKLTLLGVLNELAREKHIRHVLDGSNYDDLSEYRPGLVAISELGVRSPLAESFLTKREVRALAKAGGLLNWDRPSNACLATRLPHHTPITQRVLDTIADGEGFIRGLGVRQVRLRHHGDIARIEVDEAGFRLLARRGNRAAVLEEMNRLGYRHVTLDLGGYRPGSLN